MAPVFENYAFGAATNFISVTPTTTEPCGRIQTALEAWVAGMGGAGPDASGITILHSPLDSTTKASSTVLGWLLQTYTQRGRNQRDLILATGGVNTDKELAQMAHGLYFGWRPGNTTASSIVRAPFHSYSASTSNNGAGTFTVSGSSVSVGFLDLTVASTLYLSYESSGPTPWFFVGQYASATVVNGQMIVKVDASGYPAGSFLGGGYETFYAHYHFSTTTGVVHTPNPLGQNNLTNGWGIPGLGLLTAHKADVFTTGGNYFTAPRELFGGKQAVGRVPTDAYVFAPTAVGAYGDTVVLDGGTYMKFQTSTWFRVG